MSWSVDKNDRIVCTGGCNEWGCIPCLIDHASQPFNGVDTDDGTEYYRCPECEWMIPDPYGENKYENAGTIVCPECEQGERWDTYVGPCDFCRSKKRLATSHKVPEHLRPFTKGRFSTSRWHCCPQCLFGYTTDLEKAKADHEVAEAKRLAAEAVEKARGDWYRDRHRAHRAAGPPPGASEGCGRIDKHANSGGPNDQ